MRPGSGTDPAARPGRIGAILLVVDVEGLVRRFGRPDPDAAGMLHRIASIRAVAAWPHRRLDVALARVHEGGAQALPARGDAVEALGAAPLRLPDAAGLAQLATPERGVMLITGDEERALAAIRAGVPAYVVSDRPPSVHGHLLIRDVPRVIREALRLPTPRPVAPSARRGTLLALPEGGAAAALARGAAVLRQDAQADWLTLGEHQVFYLEDETAIATASAEEQATVLLQGVSLSSLALWPLSRRVGEKSLLSSTRYALVASGDPTPGAVAWSDARRARIDAARPASSLPAAMSSSEPDGESADAAWRTGGCICLPFAHASADRVLAVQWVKSDSAGARALADRLRHRLGGDAAVLAEEGQRPLDQLWQSERNGLRAVVHLAWAGDPGLREAVERSSPNVPELFVSGLARSDTAQWVERLVKRLA